MLPEDQLRLILCLLAAIPLSYLMTHLHNPKQLLAYTCLVSAILQMIVFQEWILLLWLQQLIVYLMCKFGPRAQVGTLVIVETFIVLSAIQATRMYLSYGMENVDITAIFMMQVFQYVSFSSNYQDGLNKGAQNNQYIIEQLPSYFEYLGFVMFIPSCLVGPVFEFRDYISYVQRAGVFGKVTPGFSLPAMGKQLKITVMSLAVYFVLRAFPLSYMLSEQYARTGFPMQALYLLVSIIGARFKYYSAWSIGMVAMHATGFTYNPKQDQQGHTINQWDRVIVSNIWDFEMDPSMKKKADGWNIPIQVALKRYIYDRIYVPSEKHSPKQKKKLQIEAQQKTLAVSALWHGLYPGYFLAFFHWALILQVSQELFRLEKQSHQLQKWRKKLYYLELVVINFFLGYFGVCFQFMTWEKIGMFFAATWYIPVICAYVANILVVRLGIFSKRSKKPMAQGTQQPQQVKLQ